MADAGPDVLVFTRQDTLPCSTPGQDVDADGSPQVRSNRLAGRRKDALNGNVELPMARHLGFVKAMPATA